MKRRIAVFSGKRGGFGALINLMKLINNDKSTNLHLIVTDMHLSKKFGYTINEIWYIKEFRIPTSDNVWIVFTPERHELS